MALPPRKIMHKRTETPNKEPTANAIVLGEIVMNIADGIFGLLP